MEDGRERASGYQVHWLSHAYRENKNVPEVNIIIHNNSGKVKSIDGHKIRWTFDRTLYGSWGLVKDRGKANRLGRVWAFLMFYDYLPNRGDWRWSTVLLTGQICAVCKRA